MMRRHTTNPSGLKKDFSVATSVQTVGKRQPIETFADVLMVIQESAVHKVHFLCVCK